MSGMRFLTTIVVAVLPVLPASDVLAQDTPADDLPHSATIGDDEPPYGASPEEVEAALQDCGKDQITINICTRSRYRDSERPLDAAVTNLLASLEDDEHRKWFAAAQKKWVEFRNLTCAFESTGPGSMGFGILYGCRLSYNERRIKSLNTYTSCRVQDCGRPYLLYLYENQD